MKQASGGVSRHYAAYALVLLALINVINYLDRNIIFVLFEPIKRELGLSDTQLGWLGSAYVIVFALAALPLAILADLKSKRAVIAAGVTVWSAFTALGGLARNFWQLFACRSLVGVGEASYSPAAQALIAQYFPSHGRAFALGLFWSGLAIGGVAGIWLGGELEHLYGWRAAFLAVGIPGLILAVLATQLRDPAHEAGHVSLREHIYRLELTVWRMLKAAWPLWGSAAIGALVVFTTRSSPDQPANDVAVFSAFVGTGLVLMVGILVWRGLQHRDSTARARRSDRTEGFVRAARLVLRTRTLVWLFLGSAMIAFAMNGLVGWSPSYMQREIGLSPQTVGRTIGFWGLAGAILGVVFGGKLGDVLVSRFPSGRVIASSAGFLIGAPLAIWLLTIEDLDLFIPVFFTTMFFFTWYNGPMTAAILDVVPLQVSASVIGAYEFFVHVAGDAIAYPLVGFLSDQFGLRLAMMILPAMALGGGAVVLVAVRTIEHDMQQVRLAAEKAG